MGVVSVSFIVLLALVALTNASSCVCTCATYNGDLPGNCNNCASNCQAFCNSTMQIYACTTTCFPASATVELENGTIKTMANLAIGDKVLVGDGSKYSEIFMFSHRDTDADSVFLNIRTTSGDALLLTPDHYLYLNRTLVIARNAKIGDILLTRDGSETTIVSIVQERHVGLYNPHTLQGDLVVNGILVSSYTSAVAPTLAHSMLWPVRMLYSLGYDIFQGIFDEGSSLMTALLPAGRDAY
jgi:hypothetical protein